MYHYSHQHNVAKYELPCAIFAVFTLLFVVPDPFEQKVLHQFDTRKIFTPHRIWSFFVGISIEATSSSNFLFLECPISVGSGNEMQYMCLFGATSLTS
mmetsp:Transcript_9206/g.34003  ORF Transcript_9206/g.34003 Transcript_9206/m.34003 type:complete len:98 (-) Transcript_9206:1088-1381(-)